MKKILLGTSALIGAATLLSGAALAEDPKVTVGGFNTFEAGYTQSDFDNNLRNRAFRNSTEVHFNIAGKSDAGINYGAEIDLNADIDGAGNGSSTSGQTNAGLNAHRTYAWVGGDAWGHFEMGSNDGAARTLKVDAANIARATGGIDGDWTYFADVNSKTGTVGNGSGGAFGVGTGTGIFITAPRLPVEHGPASGFANEQWSNNNKVTYYSPKVSGFQLGVSYSPDLANRGQATNRVDLLTSPATAARDIWEGGLSYEGQFDQIGVAAAVTGETGHAVNGSAAKNLNAWNAGAKVSFMGFSVAGSYGDWSDSFATNAAGANPENSYWTAGAAYETGPFGISATYLNSETKLTGIKDKFQDVSVGVDYKLAPGLTPFVEWTYYDMDPKGTAFDNQGNVVIVGSQLSF
jgi:outer membrane protein OmpU